MSEPENQKEAEVKTRSPKLAAEKALPQSKEETLIKIIKGYAIASNGGESEVKFTDVASVTGINKTTVSSNNRFLLDSGILIMPKYGYYIPSESAIRFARESAWDEKSAKSHLRKIVVSCWYGQLVIQKFSMISYVSKEELRKSLAMKCGATDGDLNALDFLIDFIIYTDLIVVDENGALTRGNLDEVENPVELNLPSTTANGQPSRIGAENPAKSHSPRTTGTSIVIHLHINDFDKLTPDNSIRLKEWIKSLNEDTDVQIAIGSGEPSPGV